MAGIYIHIPFCIKRCTYCNFYSTVNTYNLNNYVDALCHEAIARKEYLHTFDIDTLYFGGGTPSLLNSNQINKIYSTLSNIYNLKNLKEFTLECNPDDITQEFITSLKTTKVNRISIGIQSFDDRILSFINRRHNAESAVSAVKKLQENGYNNISIDLIYGIPGQTDDIWQKSIDTAINLKVQHISAYNLSFEKGTVMYKYRNQALDDDTCLNMYETLCERMDKEGFEHYEISNFALKSDNGKSFRSMHNSLYWSSEEYLGLGAGAHSYNRETRCWNGEIEKSSYNTLSWKCEYETLSNQDIYNDLIVTALRTKEGLDINKIDNIYKENFLKTAINLKKKGLVNIESERVIITKEGIFLSDSIMREFIEI